MKSTSVGMVSSLIEFFIGWHRCSFRQRQWIRAHRLRCFQRMPWLIPNLSFVRSNLTNENRLSGATGHFSCRRTFGCGTTHAVCSHFVRICFAENCWFVACSVRATHRLTGAFVFLLHIYAHSIPPSSWFQLRFNYFQEQKTITICFFLGLHFGSICARVYGTLTYYCEASSTRVSFVHFIQLSWNLPYAQCRCQSVHVARTHTERCQCQFALRATVYCCRMCYCKLKSVCLCAYFCSATLAIYRASFYFSWFAFFALSFSILVEESAHTRTAHTYTPPLWDNVGMESTAIFIVRPCSE